MVMNHHAASSTGVADREQSMVAEDDCLVVAERMCETLPFLQIEHDAGVVVEEAVVLVEGADVLGERFELATQRGPGLPVHRVGVRSGHDVGPGRVHLRVDHEGRLVDRLVALDDVAVVVDQNEIETRM